MSESEKITRKTRIDKKLKSSLLNWTIVPYDSATDFSQLTHHAVEEFPTASGPVDYALFVKGKLLGMIEAKRLSLGAEGVLGQTKRYSKGVANSIGEWREYKVPFLYSTNGELIFHLDVRREKNTSYELTDFHSPQALWERLNRTSEQAEEWFQTKNVDENKLLRPYQIKAVEAVEKAVISGKRKMLLAMATGTGKTFTMVSSIYRLLKSGYAKRILFLVDRRVLAAQTISTIAAFETPEGSKLDKCYEVYSQKFRKDDFEEDEAYDPKVLPEEYLIQPQAKHTFIYVSTIQRMSINLLGKEAVSDFEYDVEASKLDIPIHTFDVIIADECHRGYSANETGRWKYVLDYFDAVKIGLTATPATHTLAMFQHNIFTYSTEEAVLDGFLVNYDAVKIKSAIHFNGAFLREGELVGEIDTETGAEKLDQLEDERGFAAEEIEKKITAPDSTRKIIETIKKYTDQHEKEYQRFPKMLIFAVNDIAHISHADEVVKTCKKVFEKGDDFAIKITGKVDRPLQQIRQFRNRPEPKIVVTVDMLTTGVDIPAIEMVVFMRIVKSRILWVQMLGRGTRLCTEIHKEKFTIIDCFDGSLIEYFQNATDFEVKLGKESVKISEIIEKIYDNREREYNTKRLIKRLRRIEHNMGSEAREAFSKYIPEGDLKAYTDQLREKLNNDFVETMKLLRDQSFQNLLENYPRPKSTFFKGYDVVDEVEDELIIFHDGNHHKPEDYLKLFAEFVHQNPEQIEAIQILQSSPKSWNADVLEDLRKKLKKSNFLEKYLQISHEKVYQKSLADIISMVKKAADFEVPILNAVERVEFALENIYQKHHFSAEQEIWLAYIQEHLVANLALSEVDFEKFPIFERHGGLKRVKKVFGEDFKTLISEINAAIAA
jgi:type I restriction enzyme R subunit